MQRADLPRLLERPWQLLAAAIALYWLTALVIGVRADIEIGGPGARERRRARPASLRSRPDR